MTPQDIRAARKVLGLTLTEMAAMLGYHGPYMRQQMYRLETGDRDLPSAAVRLLRAYLEGYRPPDWPRDTETM